MSEEKFKPLMTALDDPLVKKWLETLPTFKEVFTRGFVSSIVIRRTRNKIYLNQGLTEIETQALLSEFRGIAALLLADESNE